MRGPAGVVAVALWVGLAASAAAQTGSVTGVVVDKDSGEELIAVDIVVAGTGITTQTDLAGSFTLPGLAAGNLDLRVSYLGYNTRTISGVIVKAGETTTIKVELESFRANELDDVMVTATRVLSTESAVLADRKNASVVGDAISAAQISRSPDGQAGDALQRVTGLMVDDGAYVNVRGMPDRYNVTVVDGAVVTSVDPDLDRKSFNFEMIPSNLLSSLQVQKTAVPDMPGDFTGGLVQVNTVDFPEHATTQVSIGAGADQGTHGESFYRDAYSGSHDRWGYDDGGRDLPQSVVDAGPLPNDGLAYPDEIGRALPNTWGTESVTAPMQAAFAVSHGNRFQVLGRKLGLVAAVTYKTSSEITDESKSYEPLFTYTFDATDYLTEINLGALFNLNYELAERQHLSFKNLYSHYTEESFLSAYKYTNGPTYRHVLEWEEKDQLTTSLSGEHGLPVRGLDLDWRLFYNENLAKEPDLRYLEYNLSADPIAMGTNRRHWLYADEYRRGVDASLGWTFGDLDRPTRVRAGVSFSTRERAVKNNPYHVEADGTAGGLIFLPPDQIIAPEHFKEGLFTLRYQDQFEGSYNGTQALNAYFAMLEAPFDLWQEEFRLAGGARVENNQTAVEALDKFTDQYESADSQVTNVLPSVNLQYLYNEKTNVRLGYYQSVNYPEMREIAPVKSNDFKNDWEVLGNPDLGVAKIDNYDLRVEHFPSYGEVLGVSLFYKDLNNAIETSLNPQPNYLDLLSWFNGDGKNYGFELDLRTRLTFLSRTLHDVTLIGNYVRVWSEVEYYTAENPDNPDEESGRTRRDTRQLQGQSPWVINLGAKWEEPDRGTSFSVFYNRIGRRLSSVATEPQFNVYEEPRHLLDAAVTQTLFGRATLKVAVKNILGEDKTYVFDVDQGAGDRRPEVLPYGTKRDTMAGNVSLSVRF